MSPVPQSSFLVGTFLPFLTTRQLQLLFSFGIFDSFLAGLGAEIMCMVHLDLPKWPINQFEPVEQSRHQALKAYCPNIYIYIRTVSLQSLMSALFNWFKLVNRPFGQIKMHHAHDFCPQTSQEGIKYTKAKQQLELSCCKKRQKSPNQETGLGNRGHLKVLNDTKLILNE